MKLKAIISAALACLMLAACGKQEAPVVETPIMPTRYSEEMPLICTADSQEQAEEIAARYGITLVEYSHGVAGFYTEEDPAAVIRRGKEQGWVELSLNVIRDFD
jgi:hypothetical protein